MKPKAPKEFVKKFKKKPTGKCRFCGATTNKIIIWHSNDPKEDGKADFICEDCHDKL